MSQKSRTREDFMTMSRCYFFADDLFWTTCTHTQLHMANLVYDIGSEILSQSNPETGVPSKLHPSSPHSKISNFTRTQGPLNVLWLWICCVWAWMLSMDPSFMHILACVNTEGWTQWRPNLVAALWCAYTQTFVHLPSYPLVISVGRPLCSEDK